MKNVVFMMNVDLGKEGRFASSRINPYKYSIDRVNRGSTIFFANLLHT